MNLLWVGLGNPGKKYQKTRHNMGADVLLQLFPQANWKLDKKWNALVAKEKHQKFSLTLMLPLTYMNLSGQSVCFALQNKELSLNRMLVLHDEIELLPTEVKHKFSGGHKGHNGLRHIISLCKSGDFHRLRLGVGRPLHPDFSVADYVLGKYSQEEFPSISQVWQILEQEYFLKLQ